MRSSALTSALINTLRNDATLMALTPDGVFFGVAGDSMLGGSSTRYVIVSLIEAQNVMEFHRVAFQRALYLVEARMLSTAGGSVHAAAERIDALLNMPVTLPTVPGFRVMAIMLEEPTEFTEADGGDESMLWERCGGQYRVFAAPAA